MTSTPIRALLVGGAFAAATLSLLAQTQAPPTSQQVPPPSQQGPAQTPGGRGDAGAQGRGGPGRGGRSMSEPDFSKKPPVAALTAAAEAERFWLPPGFKLEPV